MEKVTHLSRGAKLVIAAGGLLFFDLFLTWQAVPVKFGPKNTVMKGLDGWDIWGLLIGLAVLALIVLLVVRQYDEELAFDPRWDRVTLGLGALVLALAVLKNFRDSDSTWASYLGVVLAGLVVAGVYLDHTSERDAISRGTVWQPRDRTLERSSGQRTSSQDEANPRW